MSVTPRTNRALALTAALALATLALTVGIVAASAPAGARTSRSSSSRQPARHATLRWVALGDSYSAGVGSDNGPEGCDHGHLYASYASRAEPTFAAHSARPLRSFQLLACGGATTQDIEHDQLPRTQGADIVTLTAGGNDIGFVDFVERCFFFQPSGCPSQDQTGDALDPGRGGDHARTWSELHARLVDLYERISRTMQHGGDGTGQLFVLTYPIPFSVPDLERGPSCWLFDHGYHTNALLANALAERLDDEIAGAVTDAGAALRRQGLTPNVHLVDWRSANGAAPVLHLDVRGITRAVATNPDGICSGHAMTHLYRVTLREHSGQDSFHPTQYGYDVGADLLLKAMSRWFPSRDGSSTARPSHPVAFCAVRGGGSVPNSVCQSAAPPS
jgi:lysophospholipase L1-like esterase